MSTTFMIAVIFLAGFFGMLSLLGFLVLVKVFIAAMRMRAQVGSLPEQLASRQRELNAAQAALVEEQRKLAKERMAAEKKA